MKTNLLATLCPETLLITGNQVIPLSNAANLTAFGYTITTTLRAVNAGTSAVTLTVTDPVKGTQIGTYTANLGENLISIPVSDLVGLKYISINASLLQVVTASIRVEAVPEKKNAFGVPNDQIMSDPGVATEDTPVVPN